MQERERTADVRGRDSGNFGVKKQDATDLKGMILAMDGFVSFNFASAIALKRSENAKMRGM